MPNVPVQVIVFLALAYGGYHYAGKPVYHASHKAIHEVCHVVTIGKKCK